MSAKSYNPRFTEYARQTGAKNEVGALKRDRTLYPGGMMAGFMIWVSERWTEWCKLKGYRRTASGSGDDILDHAEFDAWLKARQP